MPAPKKVVALDAPELSQRDLQVAALAWSCLKTDPQVDFDQLHKLAGYSSPKVACTIWGTVKRKLQAYADATATKTADQKASSKRKAGDAAGDDDDNATSTKPKPTKKKKVADTKTMVSEA